ncbi:MAG: glycine C-acetyltransferase [Deltaproteobacteria bacterium]|nr:glycine C-acetyltransferase [Deltaproteobacteria bacterium]
MYDALRTKLQSELDGIREAGTYKRERVIVSPQDSTIRVQGGQEVLNFCANNYLGLADHHELVAAAGEALQSHGLGLASVRFICGTQDIHKQLEASVSRFLRTEDTILYSSCFDANGGLFETLCGEGDAIVSDELNHASIIDGIRLCKAERLRYKHLDLDDLDRKLGEVASARVKLVATDGVFSMDGDIAPLDKICDIAEKHGAAVMVDDSHATGFVGRTGRGSIEHCGVMERVDVVTSTLGKALGGSQGGFTSGKKEIVELLRQRSRPYLFSNTVAPPIVGAALKVLEMLSASTERRDRLEANTMRFREAMTAAGFKIRPGVHPIVPIMLGDARLATEMADRMLQRGIYVIGFSFPVVPRGQARIRVQLSAAHSPEQVDRAVAAFVEVGRELGVV